MIRIFITVLVLLSSCKKESIPKPKGKLSLSYPKPSYKRYDATPCPFSFQLNSLATPVKKKNCALNLYYKDMKATLYLSYKPVQGNLKALLRDAEKLAVDHTIRANGIVDQPFVNKAKKVYGMFFSITGNAASQSNFYLTDSTSHFITGSLYFYARPNYDSIYPAAVYVQKDIRRMMETFQWE